MWKLTPHFIQAVRCKPYIRFTSTINTQIRSDPPPTSFLKDYTPVYKFPYIRVISLLNKLKFYQSALTAIAIPGSLMLWEFDVLTAEPVMVTMAFGLSGCTTLFTFGILTNKFVGFVYLNKKEDSARVAYLDFWGRRKDIEVPVKDIIPFSEVPVSLTDKLYSKFCRVSVEEKLKINLKYGEVLNKEKFNKVFASYS